MARLIRQQATAVSYTIEDRKTMHACVYICSDALRMFGLGAGVGLDVDVEY